MKLRELIGKIVAGGPGAFLRIDQDTGSVVVTTEKGTITIAEDGIQGEDGKVCSPKPGPNEKVEAEGACPSVESNPDASSVTVTSGRRKITITPDGIQGEDGKVWSPKPGPNEKVEAEGACPSVESNPDASSVTVTSGRRKITITPDGIQGEDGKAWSPKP